MKVVTDGISALERIASREPDGIILDIGIPRKDGFLVLAEMQAKGIKIPVIVLTARTDTADVCHGFELGAVDYVRKPCEVEELIARVNARVLYPARLTESSPEKRRAAARLRRDPSTQCYYFSNYIVDPNAREVWHDGRRIKLTPTEFELLRVFIENPCEVLSPADLHVRVWGFEVKTPNTRVKVIVHRLRRKLGDKAHRHFITEHGGYRFEP